jgi:hypothetical protein
LLIVPVIKFLIRVDKAAIFEYIKTHAGVVELADARDSKSRAFGAETPKTNGKPK